MKRVVLVLVMIAAMASPAVAEQIQIGYSGSQGAYGPYQAWTPYGGGGEFTFSPLGGWLDVTAYGGAAKNIGVSGTFQTFCIEISEYIWPYGSTYDVVIEDYAAFGGGGAVEGRDTISKGTGWLYSQFARGVLGGYSYGGTEAQREASAAALQIALWYLEGEITGTIVGNAFLAAVEAQFGSLAAAMADGGSNYGVYALQLWEGNIPRQDALVLVPDGGTTLMLLGGALIGLGALRRRFRR